MTNKNNIKNLIKEYLLQKDEIEFSYIFGSFVVKENFHDVDIAVFLNEKFNNRDEKKFPYGYESKMIGELSRIIKKNVDFIVLNTASLSLIREILKNNVILFERDKDKRVHFEIYNHKLINDAESIRKIKKYYLSEKIKSVS